VHVDQPPHASPYGGSLPILVFVVFMVLWFLAYLMMQA